MCRWPWNHLSVRTYADTSHPPPPRSLTNTLRPEARQNAAEKLLATTAPLVTVDDVCPGQVADQPGMERVERLPADSPRGPENPDVKLSDGLPGRGLGKGDQPGLRLVGHVPGEFVAHIARPRRIPHLRRTGRGRGERRGDEPEES